MKWPCMGAAIMSTLCLLEHNACVQRVAHLVLIRLQQRLTVKKATIAKPAPLAKAVARSMVTVVSNAVVPEECLCRISVPLYDEEWSPI